MDEKRIYTAIARVESMERCFDILQVAAKHDPAAVSRPVFAALLRQLMRYYDSGQWLQDYQLDEAGLLPPTLKRGVLSQDGVYNFLTELKK